MYTVQVTLDKQLFCYIDNEDYIVFKNEKNETKRSNTQKSFAQMKTDA